MNPASRFLLSISVLTLITVPMAAHATNGMFLIGYGTKARGAGGVAIAMPQDSISGAVNPATISYVNSRADVGADIFMPTAEVTLGQGTPTLTTQGSRANLFAMPAMGGVYGFNRKLSMGFSAVPYGGGGSRYNTNLYNAQTFSNPDATLGVNLMVMQMNPTVAYKVNKQNSIGASLVFSVQTFRAFGLSYFAPFTQSFLDNGGVVSNLTNNGNDWSYGAGTRIGWMGNFMKKKLSLGAVYSSRVYMTKFDKYTDLFAEQGDLDTPANIGVGISYKFTPKLTLGMDVTHTFYEDVAAIGNASAQTSGSVYPNADERHRLGNDEGLGFGWDNQTVYKLGAIYDYNDHWTFRAGWNYGESPIDESNGEILMSIAAPAVTQNHLTLGATYSPSKRVEWSFSYVHAFKFEQNGPTFIGNMGELSMYQNSVGLSFGYNI